MPNDAQSFNIDFNYLVQPTVGPHSCCASALRQVGTLSVGRKVPQLFPATGAPSGTTRRAITGPWAFSSANQAEGRIYAGYILKNKPDAKIGVLYQNDDFGKDYLKGLLDGLGDKAAD